MNAKKRRAIGILLFFGGILLSVFLTTASTWADLESAFYGFDNLGYANLTSLQCPILLTTSETGEISASVKNPLENDHEVTLRMDASGPMLHTEHQRVNIPAGQTHTARWTVSKENVSLGFFIFAKVYSSISYPLEPLEGSCGIIVMDVPVLPGWAVLSLWLVGSLGLIVAGHWAWEKADHQLGKHRTDTTQGIRFMAILVLLALLFSFLGWWGLSMVLLIVSFLLTGILVYLNLAQA
jgi:hypothetical protein